jgi:Mg2+ and Co2+ transporter CorA
MWGKFLQILLTSVGLPLIEKLFKALIDWWHDKKRVDKIIEEIENEAKEIEESITEQEQKDALKKFVEGVRRRRSS